MRRVLPWRAFGVPIDPLPRKPQIGKIRRYYTGLYPSTTCLCRGRSCSGPALLGNGAPDDISTITSKLERIPSELRIDDAGGAAGFAAARALLASTTLGAYLAAKPPSAVLTLTTAQTAGQALRALAAANVLSAPLFDSGRCADRGVLGWRGGGEGPPLGPASPRDSAPAAALPAPHLGWQASLRARGGAPGWAPAGAWTGGPFPPHA